MSFEHCKSRVREGIRQSLLTLELADFTEPNIVLRKRLAADGLKVPGIVITRAGVQRLRSPAGMRNRRIDTRLLIYFRTNGEVQPDLEQQAFAVEVIAAAFDRPRQMPLPLTALVPEAEECTAEIRQEFGQAPYDADVHEVLVSIEVCQLAEAVR